MLDNGYRLTKQVEKRFWGIRILPETINKDMGENHRKPKGKRDAEIISYYLNNHTLEETAKMFSMCVTGVFKLLVRTNTPRRKHTHSPKTDTGLSLEIRFWNRVKKNANEKGCWEWQAGTNKGYGMLWVGDRNILAHRLSIYFIKGEMPSLWVLHHCDNPKCVNPDHLYEGTPQDNVNDMIRRNRRKIKNSVDIDLVREIKQLLKQGLRQKDIIDRFDLPKSTVQRIASNRAWKHVQI